MQTNGVLEMVPVQKRGWKMPSFYLTELRAVLNSVTPVVLNLHQYIGGKLACYSSEHFYHIIIHIKLSPFCESYAEVLENINNEDQIYSANFTQSWFLCPNSPNLVNVVPKCADFCENAISVSNIQKGQFRKSVRVKPSKPP